MHRRMARVKFSRQAILSMMGFHQGEYLDGIMQELGDLDRGTYTFYIQADYLPELAESSITPLYDLEVVDGGLVRIQIPSPPTDTVSSD